MFNNKTSIVFKQGDTDEKILKSMCTDDLHQYNTEELIKAMNRSGLVQKKITDKNGHQTTRWVKASEDQPADKPVKAQEEQKDSKPSKPQEEKKQHWTKVGTSQEAKSQIVQMLASGKSREDCMSEFKAQGVTWKEHTHAGINWMRACMAMNKHLTSGSETPQVSDTNNKPEEKNVDTSKEVLTVSQSKDNTESDYIEQNFEKLKNGEILQANDNDSIYMENGEIYRDNGQSTPITLTESEAKNYIKRNFDPETLKKKEEKENKEKSDQEKFKSSFEKQTKEVFDKLRSGKMLVGKEKDGTKSFLYYNKDNDSVEKIVFPPEGATNRWGIPLKPSVSGQSIDTFESFDGTSNFTSLYSKSKIKGEPTVKLKVKFEEVSPKVSEGIKDIVTGISWYPSYKQGEYVNWSSNLPSDEVDKIQNIVENQDNTTKSVIGSDYTQLTTEKESGTIEGEAHNMMVGWLKSENGGNKKPAESQIKQAANSLKDSAIKTVISSYNQDELVHQLAMAKQFTKLAGGNMDHMTLENIYKDVVNGQGSYTQEQKCNALAKLCGKDYDSTGDYVRKYASNSMANASITPMSKGYFEVTFSYDDGASRKERFDSVNSAKDAADKFIEKEDKYAAEKKAK